MAENVILKCPSLMHLVYSCLGVESLYMGVESLYMGVESLYMGVESLLYGGRKAIYGCGKYIYRCRTRKDFVTVGLTVYHDSIHEVIPDPYCLPIHRGCVDSYTHAKTVKKRKSEERSYKSTKQ